MRFFTIPSLAARIYPEALFRIRTREKILCLTFDDGPDPESTPELLEILERHNVRSIFFCDGRAAETYPGLVGMIRDRGHIVGNHGYNHLNGWSTSAGEYCRDVKRASGFTSASLFRPPYGLLRYNQYLRLKTSFRIVFWDVMPYDFDREFPPARSLEILNRRIRPGSVIVLHDRQDSTSVLFLDEFLETSAGKGWEFRCPDLQ
ncbi:MAG TPA: polysaccharide deacetylase family protein [Bacteroidales bacterium]|jgi:peptidoglycan/xylan/chitin deacetylase (PgdA/CDA1 family)|nr:polysaccharide deacetylase family protein [Bacteroidales bacterium]HOS73298.1 polysaccharide deacetylase family protein [Bacteroidales bacterium]HQH24621.1 polysaccharide deacetylase family protein [Bacteroidales bacterium]HQJ82895.1 polysaccharide deacetylase family protein [Bacteroidales bacterium]